MQTSTILAVDKPGSTVCFINSASLRVVKRLPMPLASHEAAISPNGKHAFISIYGNGVYGDNPVPGHQIAVIDLERAERTGFIDIRPYTSPHGLSFAADGMLWAACDVHACVLRVLTTTGEILDAVGTRSTGSHWVLARPGSDEVYTSNKQDHFISVVNASKCEMTGTIAVPNGTEGICFSPGGRFLYAADHVLPEVLEIDLESGLVARTIQLRGLKSGHRASHHMRVSISADGGLLAVTAYHQDRLVLVELSDLTHQVVVTTGRGPMAILFGDRASGLLYVSNHDDGSIGVFDFRECAITQTANCNAGIEWMQFIS